MGLLEKKMKRLTAIVASLDSAVVAYSGGVDSTLLLKVCFDVLGNRVIAITSVSESFPKSELTETKRIAKKIGARHVIIKSTELADPNYASNPKDRCYFCKKNLISHLRQTAKRFGIKHILNGTNADDLKEFRPGLRALKELDVRSPLQEAGLTKKEIVTVARGLRLPNWNKPASPCLASRIPYGTAVTLERLKMIATAENAVRKLGFRKFRVRYHNETARLEIDKPEMKKAFGLAAVLAKNVRKAGFKYVALDLDGFRSGSLNELQVSKK